MEITSATNATAAGASGAKSMSALTTEDFLKMLLSELTNQDPFEPVKNQDLMNQIGSIRNMEMNTQLTATLKNLILRSDLSAAGGLIGKLVAGLSPQREAVAGLVTGVRVADGQVMLELDTGEQINIEDVTRVVQGDGAEMSAG